MSAEVSVGKLEKPASVTVGVTPLTVLVTKRGVSVPRYPKFKPVTPVPGPWKPTTYSPPPVLTKRASARVYVSMAAKSSCLMPLTDFITSDIIMRRGFMVPFIRTVKKASMVPPPPVCAKET